MEELDQVPSPWKTLGSFARRATVGLVIAAALWGAWYGYAEWRVHQKLAEYRSRGEFASVEDLNDPPGDAQDDAFVWIEKAPGELEYSPAEDREWEEALRDTPWTNVRRAYVRQLGSV